MNYKSIIRQDEDFDTHGISVLDAFTDVFTIPDDLELTEQKPIFVVFSQDREHIRGYFTKAIFDLGLKEDAYR